MAAYWREPTVVTAPGRAANAYSWTRGAAQGTFHHPNLSPGAFVMFRPAARRRLSWPEEAVC